MRSISRPCCEGVERSPGGDGLGSRGAGERVVMPCSAIIANDFALILPNAEHREGASAPA